MTSIRVYTLPCCPRCEEIKELLTSLNLPYEEADMEDSEVMSELWCDNIIVQEAPVLQINDNYYHGKTLFPKGELDVLVKTVLTNLAVPDTPHMEPGLPEPETEPATPTAPTTPTTTTSPPPQPDDKIAANNGLVYENGEYKMVTPVTLNLIKTIPAEYVPDPKTDTCIVCGHRLIDHEDTGDGWICCRNGTDDLQCECFLRKTPATTEMGIAYYGKTHRMLKKLHRAGEALSAQMTEKIAAAKETLVQNYILMFGHPSNWNKTVQTNFLLEVQAMEEKMIPSLYNPEML